MKKTLLCAFGLFAACLVASAQVEYVCFDMRGSFNETLSRPDGSDALQGKARFLGEHLNLMVKGKLGSSLTYFLRQRFTKPLYNAEVPLNATDILTLTWDISPKWSLQGGKLPGLIGGFEWDEAPIDLYYWDLFANNISEVYALGVAGMFRPAEEQMLQLQVTQSLVSPGKADVWHVALGWYGRFSSWWSTIWSVNYMDDIYHHRMGYVSLGNRFHVGPVALEWDIMYRRSMIQRQAGLDMSTVARLIVEAGSKWRFFSKGGYDFNDACNVDPDGIAYDLTVAPGTRHSFLGVGAEYFPLGNRDIRLHALAVANNTTRELNFLAGITYRLYLVR